MPEIKVRLAREHGVACNPCDWHAIAGHRLMLHTWTACVFEIGLNDDGNEEIGDGRYEFWARLAGRLDNNSALKIHISPFAKERAVSRMDELDLAEEAIAAFVLMWKP